MWKRSRKVNFLCDKIFFKLHYFLGLQQSEVVHISVESIILKQL
jgi:hypothetical protein